ncbi:hypothetical protein MMC29_005003, partial [Sticta canariensis]|nr:hypothetical protein [Sticta canariensis]
MNEYQLVWSVFDLWFKIKDEELLQSARTFLDVSESSLADEKPSPPISARSGTIGTSGLGIFGAAMNVDVVLPRGRARLPRIDYYNDIIRTAKNMPIILYDTEQQVWLVPMLSVISHMAHTWVATQAPPVQLPYAQPDWDGSQAAWNMIAESSRLELQRSLEDDTPYFLKDLVKRLWEHSISCFDSTMLDMRRNRGMIETGRPKLRNWEYMDIIDLSPRSRMKEQVLDRNGGGWHMLTEDLPVLAYRGLGEIIQPAQPGSLCPNCIPRSEGIEEPCHQTLQQLVNKGWGHEPNTILPAEGAVLFVHKVNKLKEMAPRSMAKNSGTLIVSGNVLGSSNPGIGINDPNVISRANPKNEGRNHPKSTESRLDEIITSMTDMSR